jgi:hypothetical protein
MPVIRLSIICRKTTSASQTQISCPFAETFLTDRVTVLGQHRRSYHAVFNTPAATSLAWALSASSAISPAVQKDSTPRKAKASRRERLADTSGLGPPSLPRASDHRAMELGHCPVRARRCRSNLSRRGSPVSPPASQRPRHRRSSAPGPSSRWDGSGDCRMERPGAIHELA